MEEDLRPLLRACLARKPEERVGSAEAFRALLTPLRRARPEAGPSELAQWFRRVQPVIPESRRTVETVLDDGETGSSG